MADVVCVEVVVVDIVDYAGEYISSDTSSDTSSETSSALSMSSL